MSSPAHAVTVGVLRERVERERRVALVPNDVGKLATRMRVVVETGAGAQAGHDDAAYAAAGASVLPRADVLGGADIALAIRPLADLPREGCTLIGFGGHDPGYRARLEAHGVLHLALERMPRITRAQAMDALSSQASCAGYAAVLEGARHLDVMLPMLTTAAGIVRPAKMIALGAGVAGLQALATARRLGAQTWGFDVRAAAAEQVESLGAKFVGVETAPSAEAAGGYAVAQSDDEQVRLRRALAPHLDGMQLIVTTAQIPGRPAPLLIDDDTLARLTPGTVIVDLAAETGGNTSATRADEVVECGGVIILGPTDLPSRVARDASMLLSGNMRALLAHLVGSDGALRLDHEDAILGPMIGAQALPAPAEAVAAPQPVAA